MNKVGITPEGKPTVDGVFKFYDTIGIPLSDVVAVLDAKGIIPAWDVFAQDALNAGWKPKKILALVEETVVELKGRKTWERDYAPKLQAMLDIKEKA